MLSEPQEFLRCLFAIDDQTIAADIANARGRGPELAEETARMMGFPFNARTPEVEAKIAHHMMVMAHEFSKVERLPEEVRAYYAQFGVQQIANEVSSASAHKDRLGVVTAAIESLNRKHGLCGDLSEEMPPELRALHAEYESLAERIDETVIPSLFRRYHMEEFAVLYETDRTRYDWLVEIGRRAVSRMPLDIEEVMDQHFIKEHGEQAFRIVMARVEEIKILWKKKEH